MRNFLLVAVAILTTGCSYFDREGRREALLDSAQAQGWQGAVVDAAPFRLATLSRDSTASSLLTVYIEGDGRAWLSRSLPSDDPTPERPVGLRLALADPSPRILYLARPCQYVAKADRAGCDLRYWTSHRFAPEVIDALSRAIDGVKTRNGADSVEVIGYSGGGVAAALIAARRTDVRRIVTVAANLDLAAWTRTLGVDAMKASLDPARETARIAGIAQYHLAGEDDETVPPSVLMSYMARGATDGGRRIAETVSDYDHECCWHRDWAVRINAIRARLPI